MDDKKMYLEVINNIFDGVYFVDTQRRITLWNKSAENISGYKAEEIVGRYCNESQLHYIDTAGLSMCISGCPLLSTLEDGKARKHEVFLKHKKGHRIPILVSTLPIVEKNNILGAIEIFTQSSPNIYDDDYIEKLSASAMKDQLTGLPNRRNIAGYFEYKLSELKRFKKKFCLIFLDIDNFSLFNDTYGHDLGDKVLKAIAKSITGIIRKTDLFGRWGGEEFIGLFSIKDESDVPLLGEKIRSLIENSFVSYEGKNIYITASLGATAVLESDTEESAVKRADWLMYQSKQNGKNCVTSD